MIFLKHTLYLDIFDLFGFLRHYLLNLSIIPETSIIILLQTNIFVLARQSFHYMLQVFHWKSKATNCILQVLEWNYFPLKLLRAIPFEILRGGQNAKKKHFVETIHVFNFFPYHPHLRISNGIALIPYENSSSRNETLAQF